MSLRDLMNRRPAVGAAMAVGLLAVAVSVFYVASRRPGVPAITYSYFYNLDTRQVFVHDNAGMPPILDGKGVKAEVFSCGQCADKSTHFIGWLEQFTPEAKQASVKRAEQVALSATTPGAIDPTLANVIQRGRRIAADPGDKGDVQWRPVDSQDAFAIQAQPATRCAPPAVATPCAPSRGERP